MSEVTREDKMNKILEYWNESWESGDFSEIMDELEGLHNGEKRLASEYYNKVWKAAQQLNWTCEEISEFLKSNFNTNHKIALKKLEKIVSARQRTLE